MADQRHITTTGGNPVADNQNSETVGRFGPIVLQDYKLLEKLAHRGEKGKERNDPEHPCGHEPPRSEEQTGRTDGAVEQEGPRQ